jgi:uncharacterized RDD family membrane protein YckC
MTPWEQSGMTLDQAWEAFEFPPGLEPGGLKRRWLARLIDLLVLMPVIVPAGIFMGSDPGIVAERAVAIGVAATWAVYEVGMTARYGATLGKRWTRIRVVRMVDIKHPTVWASLGRWVFQFLSVATLPRLLLSAFSSSSDGEGRQRSWADRVARTVVLREPVEWRGI